MAIFRKGNSFSDTGGGIDISEAIRRIAGVKRGKGRLKPAPEREGIAESVGEAVPVGVNPLATGAIASPLVEQAYTGSTYYNLTSSDGFLVFEFPDQTSYIDNDGVGDTIVVKHLNPNP